MLIIAETKPMASRRVDVNAEELKSSIDSSRRAIVYGIYFDTAKTALKPHVRSRRRAERRRW